VTGNEKVAGHRGDEIGEVPKCDGEMHFLSVRLHDLHHDALIGTRNVHLVGLAGDEVDPEPVGIARIFE